MNKSNGAPMMTICYQYERAMAINTLTGTGSSGVESRPIQCLCRHLLWVLPP